ncbi:MAG: ribulose-phosphate 3-epimerase [Selenomonadaceae bacterium]|nr:ribulose-phosphate 3-epimerase [Selenomonadaceae bacterium]
MIKVSPSILSADFANLGAEVKKVVDAGAEYVHIDVMDGTFVPEITLGAGIVKAVRTVTDAVFDVHLMVEHPDTQIESFIKAGADIITFHVEAAKHPHRVIQAIHAAGCKAGISLNPGTPVAMVEELLADVDLVLVMSVNPGYGGQKFIPASLSKLRRLRAALDACGSQAELEVDGGVTEANAQEIIEAGATVLVAGSAVYKSKDIKATIKALHGRN